MVNYKINVYLKHTEMENMYVREFIELVTQDVNGNNFEFTVYEDDNVYDLTNKRVTMVVKSDSGTVIQENCQVVDAKQGKATITLPPDMLIENGPYMAEVQIWEGVNSRVTTLPFDYTVRLSLENDESIKADPRFSLLQVALQNVNDADGKSKEALKLSKEAKAICDDLVPEANTASQNAQTALDRAESVVTKEELAQKVMLGGKDTKFDFIENKVVQDGLIYENRVVTNRVNSGIILTNNFTISMTLSASSKTDNQYFLGNYSDSRGLYLFCNNGVIKLIIDTIALDTIKPEPNEFYNVSIVCIEGECSVFINGIKYTHTVRYVPNNIRLAFGGYNGSSGELGTGKLKNVLIYNLPRAPQEIQNNFSVLNNLPSIKELHTTDSTGKTSILKLGSDEDHVEMASGRTLREEYMGVLKTMGKEFTSADGSPVEVNNGIEARLINGEIKGKTVKSQAYNWKNTIIDYTTKQLGLWHSINNNVPCVIILKVAEIKNNPNLEVQVTYNTSLTAYPKTVLTNDGYYKIDLSTYGTNIRIDYIRMVSPLENQSLKLVEYTIINKSDADYVSQTFNGLNSTQAIIKNNGQQYPIYASEEDKANKKVILCHGLGSVGDTVTLNEDGSGRVESKYKDINADSTQSWNTNAITTTHVQILLYVNDGLANGLAISDKIPLRGSISATKYVYIDVPKTSLGDLTGLSDAQIYTKAREYCMSLSGFIRYQLATPIVTTIPKEIMPTILTHNQTNILEVGGAVKPSSFKVTLPVDRIAELTARLEAVEAKTNTQPVNTAFVDETYAKSVNKIEEVIK